MTVRLGREGDGPGEFRAPNTLLPLPPDSIGVYDTQHKRLSVFDGDGVLCREITLDVGPIGSAYRSLLPLAGGDLVIFTVAGFGDGSLSGIFRAESESILVDSDGVQRASYGFHPGIEMFVGEGAAGAVLFGAMTFAACSGEDFIIGTTEKPEVEVYGPDGHLSRIIRWPDHERRVTEERFERFVEAALATLPEANHASARALIDVVPRAEMEPAYWDILASQDGHLWIGSYLSREVRDLDAPYPARQWLVFDVSGSLVATAETPPGFKLMAIRGERVFGVLEDDLGIESVRAYQIARS